MNKKFGLVVSLVLCFLLLSGAAYASPMTTLIDSNTSKLVAQNHLRLSAVGYLEDWKGANLSDYIPLYDLEGNINAYGYNVLLNGKAIGYIIVSNNKSDAPIPEFGVGGSLPFTNYLDHAKEVAQKHINMNQTLDDGKFIYTSVLDYLVDFTVYEGGQKKKSIRLNLSNDKILEQTDIDIINNIDHVNKEKNQKAWSRLTTSTLGTNEQTIIQPMSLVIEKTISGVPFYKWYRGCVPTSTAMVMAYWDAHGYSNLPTGTTLIDELANAMGTNSKGETYLSNAPPAIVDVALNHGYSSWAATNDGIGRAYSTYSEYVNEINGGRPLLATVYDSTTYLNHSMAGVGYRYDDYQDWIIVHDTGDVYNQKYLDYNASEVNSPQWTYIYP